MLNAFATYYAHNYAGIIHCRLKPNPDIRSTWLKTELGKLLYESNILHITCYFYEVIYYSYILLYQKSNSVILLLLSKIIIQYYVT